MFQGTYTFFPCLFSHDDEIPSHGKTVVLESEFKEIKRLVKRIVVSLNSASNKYLISYQWNNCIYRFADFCAHLLHERNPNSSFTNMDWPLLASLIYGNSLLASVNMMDRIHFPIVMKVMKTSCRILIILVPTPTTTYI